MRTKRLRFQVEKVLPSCRCSTGRSRPCASKTADANTVIFNIVNTFKLKVERYGGTITANLDALDAIVTIDEMHFTNVIFNLLDNAVKYRSEERPPATHRAAATSITTASKSPWRTTA